MSDLQDDRFEFGKNWRRFLKSLTPERIEIAERSLVERLSGDLRGKTFLDIGSGSGLFSLCARRLGAKVHSFDYDPHSVACTEELRRRFFPEDPDWIVERGSALDQDYLAGLGRHDVVYSWGVLHHTGSMWEALANAADRVKPGGLLFISIYNDQGVQSRIWHAIKKLYVRLPALLRLPYTLAVVLPLELVVAGFYLLRLKPAEYVERWTNYQERSLRGMSLWTDHVDWIGGFPFEVAKPEEIFDFHRERGFTLEGLRTTQRWGCNEFVFRRDSGNSAGR